jgi:hypothetical protein
VAVRKELINDLASVLDDHHPAWVVGCECMPVDEETGVGEVLETGWAEHLAEIALNFALQELQVRDIV